MGAPVTEGIVELPEGLIIMMPEAVDLLPDAVEEAVAEEAEPEDLGTSVAGIDS